MNCGKLKYSYPQLKKKLSTFVENLKVVKKQLNNSRVKIIKIKKYKSYPQ